MDGLQRFRFLLGVFLGTSVSQLMPDEEVDVVSVSPVFLCISPFFVALVLDQTLQFVEMFHSADVVDGGSLWHEIKSPRRDYKFENRTKRYLLGKKNVQVGRLEPSAESV